MDGLIDAPLHSDAQGSSVSAAQLAVELEGLSPQLEFRRVPRGEQMLEIFTFGLERGTDPDDGFTPSPNMSWAPYNLTHSACTHARTYARRKHGSRWQLGHLRV